MPQFFRFDAVGTVTREVWVSADQVAFVVAAHNRDNCSVLMMSNGDEVSVQGDPTKVAATLNGELV